MSGKRSRAIRQGEKTARELSLEVVYVPIGDIKPDPANPRHMPEAERDALARSMREFECVTPLLVRREDGTLIDGHQRLLVARHLGLEVVPVIYLEISLLEAELLGVALNRIGGEFDQSSLAHLLATIAKSTNLDLTLSGFSQDEVASLLRGLEAKAKADRPETIHFDVALRDAYEGPRAKRGDLFHLGDHRLLCGDATSAGDVERLLSGIKVSMAFCDPPYGIFLGDHGGQQSGQKRRRLKNDDLAPEAFQAFCEAWASTLMKNVTGAIYVCMASAQLALLFQVLATAGGHWSDFLIWSKDQFVLGRADYQRAYEPIWYGWPEGTKRQFHGGRGQSDVWVIPRPSDSPLHPTTKPLDLVERAINNSSKPADSVLDLFLGSGSTLIACERTGRICYGLELDEHYASLAIARWEAFSGEKARKVTD
jgi:DNA modification methylase